MALFLGAHSQGSVEPSRRMTGIHRGLVFLFVTIGKGGEVIMIMLGWKKSCRASTVDGLLRSTASKFMPALCLFIVVLQAMSLARTRRLPALSSSGDRHRNFHRPSPPSTSRADCGKHGTYLPWEAIVIRVLPQYTYHLLLSAEEIVHMLRHPKLVSI